MKPSDPPRPRRRHLLLAATASFVVPMGARAAAAIDYPTRTIKLINPFPSGSPVDTVGRLVAERLQSEWGQAVVVESRSGAGGTLGTAFVARAAPDGYTLLVSVPSVLTVAPWIYRTLPYDPVADVLPVWGVESGGLVMVVRPSLNVASVKDFVAYCKQNPDKVNYGSAGLGSPQHLAAEQFMLRTGVRMNHVPFQGAAPALNNLLGGYIDVMFDSISNVLQQVRANQIRALALLRPHRSPSLPNVETMAEAGVPNADSPGSIGIFAPKGVPTEIVAKLEVALSRLMAQPKTLDLLVQAGTARDFLVGKDYERRLVEERALFGSIVREAKIQPQ